MEYNRRLDSAFGIGVFRRARAQCAFASWGRLAGSPHRTREYDGVYTFAVQLISDGGATCAVGEMGNRALEFKTQSAEQKDFIY
jgi:hypothetical protein